MGSFLHIFSPPLQNSQKHFGILWITVYNDTIIILERLLIITEYFNPEAKPQSHPEL